MNPLEKDPQGFRQRRARRIEQGRTCVWVDGQRCLVNPSLRGQRLRLRCMSQRAQNRLSHTQSLCLLVIETNTAAQLFYKKAGYKLRGIYDTISLALRLPPKEIRAKGPIGRDLPVLAQDGTFELPHKGEGHHR